MTLPGGGEAPAAFHGFKVEDGAGVDEVPLCQACDRAVALRVGGWLTAVSDDGGSFARKRESGGDCKWRQDGRKNGEAGPGSKDTHKWLDARIR